MDKIVYQTIGVIRSPHRNPAEIPAQPVFAKDIAGQVELNLELIPGLDGLSGFSHIYLFYHFHGSQGSRLRFKPYLAEEEFGIFATRAPHRPNALGMSVVRLHKIEENILHVLDVDILDGTPLLDIKPFVQRFDARKEVCSGWQDAVSDELAAHRGLRDYRK